MQKIAEMHSDRKHVLNPLGNKVQMHYRKLKKQKHFIGNTNVFAHF